MKIYKCKKCGNIVYSINEKNVPFCCGEEMVELKAGEVDAAVEKHVPVINQDINILNVKVGEVEHPMTEEHYIEFIMIETNYGVRINKLNPSDAPRTTFVLADDEKLLNTYAYCNLHGLWKA